MTRHVLTLTAPLGADRKPMWLRLNGGHGNRYARADLIHTWRQLAAVEARRQGLPRITDYPVRIIATVHLDTRPSRHDPTNWLPTAKAAVDGLVLHPRHGGWDVLADDDSRHVVGPDMRAGEQWADAALVLTIEPIHQEEA
jgi:crossover junction endodeoxyribonuclease RusA